MTYKGIIIRCSQYKDYDAMINLLTKDGLISFKGKNVFKYDNKNNILSNILLLANFTFSDNTDKFLLYKEADAIFDSRKYLDDIKILSFLNFINEVILKCVHDDDLVFIYDDLSFILENIETINLNLSITYFLSKVINISGYRVDTSDYNLDTNISFDFTIGKFIDLSNYDEKKNRKYSIEEKTILFESSNKCIKNIKNSLYQDSSIKNVNNDLINYINDVFGTILKSTKMIKKVL